MAVVQASILTEPQELLNQAHKLKAEGHRLVQIGCTMLKDGRFEVNYSFDKNERDLQWTNLRLQIDQEVEVESISGIFPPAFLYENEVKELFGVKVQNMALDFQNTLYQKSADRPFNNQPSEVSPAEAADPDAAAIDTDSTATPDAAVAPAGATDPAAPANSQED